MGGHGLLQVDAHKYGRTIQREFGDRLHLNLSYRSNTADDDREKRHPAYAVGMKLHLAV